MEMWDRAVAATEELGCASVDEAVNFVTEMERMTGAAPVRLREGPSAHWDPSEPQTQVREIELRDDGSITLTVEVFGFAAGTLVEISGWATQANETIATFIVVQPLPPSIGPAAALFSK